MSLSYDKLLIGWGEPYRTTAKEIDLDKPAFYLSDFFFVDSLPWIQYPHWIEMTNEDFEAQLEPFTQIATNEWIIHHPERFREAFNDLWHRLQANELRKAVPYLFAISFHLMTKERLQNCLKKAIFSLKQKIGYLYGYWNQTQGILGITPEFLFSHSESEPQKVQTMALAGTCHSSACQESFIKNEKEKEEHELVVQGISESLHRLGIVKIKALQLLQLPKLTHLMTPIELELNHPFDYETLVHCLHPTPALGAFPLEKGYKWLEDYERHTPRSYYGAPLGFRYPQKGLHHCSVGIRNVQWNDSGMRIGVGCGVVKQSIFDKEWQEIQFKIRAIRDQLYL